MIQERDANNLPLVSYTRGKDLSGTLQGAGCIGGMLSRTDHGLLPSGSPSAHAYYHADGGGNVTAILDTKQNIVARYLYDPFGSMVSERAIGGCEPVSVLQQGDSPQQRAVLLWLPVLRSDYSTVAE